MNEKLNNNNEYHNNEQGKNTEFQESRLTTILKIISALIAISGMIFLSGIYQASVYSKTSEKIKQNLIPNASQTAQIKIPLTIFVMRGSDLLTSKRDEKNIFNLVENANNIWNQANIYLWVKKIVSLRLSKDEVSLFLNSPREFITALEDYNPDSINMFLTRTLNGINGIAFIGIKSAAVADKTTVYDFRAFAHEIGHLLGLRHTQDKNLLMYKGANSAQLNAREISIAREFAEDFSIRKIIDENEID